MQACSMDCAPAKPPADSSSKPEERRAGTTASISEHRQASHEAGFDEFRLPRYVKRLFNGGIRKETAKLLDVSEVDGACSLSGDRTLLSGDLYSEKKEEG